MEKGGSDTVRPQSHYSTGNLQFYHGFQTTAAVQAFFLVMAMHPDVQHKAQVELDTVIGPDRLPDFNDRDKLPYINAIVKETLRWHSIVPLGKGDHIP